MPDDQDQPQKLAEQPEPGPPKRSKKHPSKILRRRQLVFVVLSALVLAAIIKTLVPPPNPVPPKIRSAVNFPVYFPVQSRLPRGYTLDPNFHVLNNVVFYAVETPNGSLVFTVRAQPGGASVRQYNASLPHAHSVKTANGTASVGTGNSRVVASLAMHDAWIIIDGPAAADNAQLPQVLRSIQRP
jgi:hypothetical protein